MRSGSRMRTAPHHPADDCVPDATDHMQALGYVAQPQTPIRPTVVCLCGSTRFFSAFQEANYRETIAGNIVLSVGFYPHATPEAHGEEIGITAEQKAALDELHLRKIDLADEILVLNQGGYVGESTRREIQYAWQTGKVVRWLEANRRLRISEMTPSELGGADG